MADKRAVRDFPAGPDFWTVADGWAGRQSYKVIEQSDDRRLYQKGQGFWTGAREVELRRSGEQAHLEAWVAARFAARLMAAFLLPAEITIESGGAKAVIPRKQGRSEVNDLMQAMGQQPIE